MTLKSLYSKFILQICEGTYAEADKSLEQILTEKVKRKIGKVVEDCKDSDGKCTKSKTKCCKPKNTKKEKMKK